MFNLLSISETGKERGELSVLISVLCSMMSYLAYYGHVQNTSHLGQSITTSHLLGALVEVKMGNTGK